VHSRAIPHRLGDGMSGPRGADLVEEEPRALGACGSRPLMVTSGSEESQIPSSPARRRARSGQHV
jgi:hypothetical protein